MKKVSFFFNILKHMILFLRSPLLYYNLENVIASTVSGLASEKYNKSGFNQPLESYVAYYQIVAIDVILKQ